MPTSLTLDTAGSRVSRAFAVAVLLHLGAFAFGPPVLFSHELPERALHPTTPPPVYRLAEHVTRDRPSIAAEAARPEVPVDPDPDLIEPHAPPPPPPPGERSGMAGPATGTEAGGFVVWVDDPVVVTRVAPAYPDLAQRAEATGTVEVLVTIDREGFVRSASIHRSTAIGVLEDAALDAARRWRFRPARQRGQAVEARTVLRFRFRL